MNTYKRPTIIYGKIVDTNQAHEKDEIVFLMETLPQGQTAYLDEKKEESGRVIKVILKDDWATTVIAEKERVNIIMLYPPSDLSTLIVSDTTSSFIIVNPDSLLTVTNIAVSYTCLRRSILSQYIASYFDSKYSIFGRLRHDLMEVTFVLLVNNSFHPVYIIVKMFKSPNHKLGLRLWSRFFTRKF